eukprot:1660322-Amphidinium_carterae.1
MWTKSRSFRRKPAYMLRQDRGTNCDPVLLSLCQGLDSRADCSYHLKMGLQTQMTSVYKQSTDVENACCECERCGPCVQGYLHGTMRSTEPQLISGLNHGEADRVCLSYTHDPDYKKLMPKKLQYNMTPRPHAASPADNPLE